MAVATGTAEQVKQRRYQKRTGNQLVPYLFIAPHLIFFLIFVAYPFFYGLYISFFRFDFLRPEAQQFVLLDNYAKLFSPDSI